MNGNQIITVVLLVMFLYGFYYGWMQLTCGNGVICSHIPQKALEWINKKKVGSVIIKVFIGVLLSYIFVVITFMKLIMAFLALLFHIWSK